MKNLLKTCISGLLLVLAAPSAQAQGFVSLAFDDCLVDGGLQTKNNNCTTSNFAHYLVAAFDISSPQTQFVGNEVVFDMEQDGAVSLDAWWQWDGAGCRSGGLAAIFDPSLVPSVSAASCLDPFAASANGASGAIGLIQRPSSGTGIGPASQRIIVGVALQSNDPVALASGTDYIPVTLRYRATLAQRDACGGIASCQTPVAITLNSILVAQLPGSPGGDVTVSAPKPFPGQQGAFFSNCVGVNGSTTCPSGATPAQSSTWGQLKSLYR
jgi:hypothetical protein